jgi:hypothetical protein
MMGTESLIDRAVLASKRLGMAQVGDTVVITGVLRADSLQRGLVIHALASARACAAGTLEGRSGSTNMMKIALVTP